MKSRVEIPVTTEFCPRNIYHHFLIDFFHALDVFDSDILIYLSTKNNEPVKSLKLLLFRHSCEGVNPVNSYISGCRIRHPGLDPGPV